MRINYKLLLLLCCFSLGITAQQTHQKLSKTIKVNPDVTIDLNSSYVQIEIDTWHKNQVGIEAYIADDNLTAEELKEALKQWDLKVEGSGDFVKISSEGAYGSWANMAPIDIDLESLNLDLESLEVLRDMDFNFAEMPEMPEMPELPEMPEMNLPEAPEMPELPELPELPEGVSNISFDAEAYKKRAEAYLETWSQDYADTYGNTYKEKMKIWGRKMAKVDFKAYEKKMEAWGETFGKGYGEDYGKKMAAWGEEFGKRFDDEWSNKMAAWGEKYGAEMEVRSKLMEKRMEAREKAMEKRQEHLENRQEGREKRNEKLEEKREERKSYLVNRLGHAGKSLKKVIKIKMPKNAKLKLNVRHGELKIVSMIYNLKADISHASLVADHIDGSETSINVSYSPVKINTWTAGSLSLKYVGEANIQTIERLLLSSNSSNIDLGTLSNSAIIDGSFGDLNISKIADTFSNLNITLENSNAVIALPKTDYSIYFKGKRSLLNDEPTNQKTIEHSPNGSSSSKTIVLNAKYSEVVLKE